MVLYPAFIHQDPDRSGYGVTFPDFPGCVSDGDTLEDARAMAEEALGFHIEGMRKDGEAIPDPSTLDEIAAEAGAPDIKAIIAVPAEVKTEAVRINIILPKSLLGEIDRHAGAHGLTRSGFLVKAAREAIKDAA